MDLEEHTNEPVVEHTCTECGATLTAQEIEASLDSGGPFLCTIHGTEELPLEDEDQPA